MLCTSQKSFPSNDITYFFTVTHFFHSKHLIQKCFSKLLSQGSIEHPGFDKSLYLLTYVREKLVVAQTYFITSTLSCAHEILIQLRHTFYLALDIYYVLMKISKKGLIIDNFHCLYYYILYLLVLEALIQGSSRKIRS